MKSKEQILRGLLAWMLQRSDGTLAIDSEEHTLCRAPLSYRAFKHLSAVQSSSDWYCAVDVGDFCLGGANSN